MVLIWYLILAFKTLIIGRRRYCPIHERFNIIFAIEVLLGLFSAPSEIAPASIPNAVVILFLSLAHSSSTHLFASIGQLQVSLLECRGEYLKCNSMAHLLKYRQAPLGKIYNLCYNLRKRDEKEERGRQRYTYPRNKCVGIHVSSRAESLRNQSGINKQDKWTVKRVRNVLTYITTEIYDEDENNIENLYGMFQNDQDHSQIIDFLV